MTQSKLAAQHMPTVHHVLSDLSVLSLPERQAKNPVKDLIQQTLAIYNNDLVDKHKGSTTFSINLVDQLTKMGESLMALLSGFMNKVDLNAEIEEMYATYLAKNKDYGDSFAKSLNTFGIDALLIRLGDKLSRLESLTQKDSVQLVMDEKLEDTIKDAINYVAMTIKYVNNKIVIANN